MTSRTVEQWLITAPQETFEALLAVTAERSRQEDKGYTPLHDDESSLTHLVTEAWQRLGRLGLSYDADTRKGLVQVAAMLVASIESIDRLSQVASTGEPEP